MSPLRLPLLLLVLLAPLGCGEQVASPPATPTPATEAAPTEFSRPYLGYVPELWAERRATFLITDERTGKPIEGAVITRHVEMVMGPDGWGPEADRVVTDAVCVEPGSGSRSQASAWGSRTVVRAPGQPRTGSVPR